MRIEEPGVRIEGGGAIEAEAAEPNPQSLILDPEAERRLRWRARRGLLELDIVLGRFIDVNYMRLDGAERDAFEALLDMSDNALWDMIAGRAERGAQDTARGEQQALLEKIRAV